MLKISCPANIPICDTISNHLMKINAMLHADRLINKDNPINDISFESELVWTLFVFFIFCTVEVALQPSALASTRTISTAAMWAIVVALLAFRVFLSVSLLILFHRQQSGCRSSLQ